jgi:hypothetical protein
MLFKNKRRRHGAMIVGLVGLMLLLTAVVVSPALANTFYLERFRADPQSVTVEDATGTHRALLYADLNGLPDGTLIGPITLLLYERKM